MTQTTNHAGLSDAVYQLLTTDDAGRLCRDIPESACRVQPQNFVTHVVSLAATKTGDGLVDPKLVLAWLIGALGAPTYLVGFLVPVREAGALVPQLVIAGAIRTMPIRKWAWAAGSLMQGLAVAGMAATALLLEGAAAGWSLICLLAAFAVARSVCSVSYKDVLGKTVAKATRGTVSGTAGTIASAMVLAYGLLLSLELLDKTVTVVAGGLLLAAILWLIAAAVFASLPEEPGATGGGVNALGVASEQISLLYRDRQFALFIIVRALLLATALAPPYMLALAGKAGERSVGGLGLFVIAAGAASISSNFVWGRLADISSRRVLAFSAAGAAAVLAMIATIALLQWHLLAVNWLLPAFLFLLMVAYQGVRLGRSTHIVDMSDAEQRANYTAVSNTVIGVLLIAGGGFGAIAQVGGEVLVLALFAVMCLAAAIAALGLEEVQSDG